MINIYFDLRILSRLVASSDPDQALIFASKASELGDIGAPALQAYMIDYGRASSGSLIGKERLSTISQLIVKLDPVYAYNATKFASVKDSCFTKQLIGTVICSVFNFIILYISKLERVYNSTAQGSDTMFTVGLHNLSL